MQQRSHVCDNRCVKYNRSKVTWSWMVTYLNIPTSNDMEANIHARKLPNKLQKKLDNLI